MLIPYLISGGGAIVLLIVAVAYLYKSNRAASRTIGRLENQLMQEKVDNENKMDGIRKELKKYKDTLSRPASVNHGLYEKAAGEYHTKYVSESDLPGEGGEGTLAGLVP